MVEWAHKDTLGSTNMTEIGRVLPLNILLIKYSFLHVCKLSDQQLVECYVTSVQ